MPGLIRSIKSKSLICILIILFVVFRYQLKEFSIILNRINYDQILTIKNEVDDSTENNIDDQINESSVNQTCNECYRIS